MTVETKFDICNIVYVLTYKGIESFAIQEIRINRGIVKKFSIKPFEWTTIQYYMNGDWYDEDKLHTTKEELIKTL
jgi:hypothetical protein